MTPKILTTYRVEIFIAGGASKDRPLPVVLSFGRNRKNKMGLRKARDGSLTCR